MSARLSFNLRRAHKLLALVVGLQVLFWTASGLFFTLIPIETIRGEHLVHATLPLELSADDTLVAPTSLAGGSSEVVLKPTPFGPVYEVKSSNGFAVYDARDGAALTPWDEVAARQIAEAYWTGEDEFISIKLIETPPREAGSATPMWRAEYDSAVLWIDPNRLAKPRVRTTNWRIFDVLWRFHIMDITGDDRFDSWWLRIFAFLGLTTVLFGIALLVDRARRGVLLK